MRSSQVRLKQTWGAILLDIDRDTANRIETRLERLGLSPEEADGLAGLRTGAVRALIEARGRLPQGQALQRLAAALETELEFLLGLEPGDLVPAELLEEPQGELGLLAPDEEALLHNYRKLDVPARAAFGLILARAAGADPSVVPEKPPPATTKGKRRGK